MSARFGTRASSDAATPGFIEFVALIALMMGLTALSIDNLLPAFDPIRDEFALADPNTVQYLVYAYMIGFGVSQIAYGPIADVVGRRPALMTGIGIYAVGCIIAIFAQDFTTLIVARIIQGIGAASARVLSVAIVRDRYEGREMARVMSLTMMVFIIVPVLAPAVGSAVLQVGSWHLIFASMLLLGVLLGGWFYLRMPETLRPEYRHPFSLARIGRGMRMTITSRVAVGYGTAMGLMFGCLMAYVGSSQQIFETEVYQLGPYFPVAFGGIAAGMSIAALLNARLVRRLGTRRLSHGGICGFAIASAAQVAVALIFDGRPPLLLFSGILACNLFLFSLTVPNFNAMSMEPLGAVAGTASSFIGFYTTLVGALLGLAVGQAFDGTVVPLGTGFLVLSLLGIGVVLWTEHGRLFRPHHPDPVRPAR